MHHKRSHAIAWLAFFFVTGLPRGWLGSDSETVFESVDRFKVEAESRRGDGVAHVGGLFSRGFGQNVPGNQVRRW